MRPNHEILNIPLAVPSDKGCLQVLKRAAESQSGMGEALTLDTIINSIDTELIAMGTSAKGPNRGAIVRHGRFTLWAFEGAVDDMTEAGRRLFVNTVVYASGHRDSPILERRMNKTRDGPFSYLEAARNRSPGLLSTLGRYLPEEARGRTIDETESWLIEKRPFLRAQGRVFEVDTFAEDLDIPNHKRELLERCIANLRSRQNVQESFDTLVRYTGQGEFGDSAEGWQGWYDTNRDYLFFSDCDGFRFIVDEQAKAAAKSTSELRGWSSQHINYRETAVRLQPHQ